MSFVLCCGFIRHNSNRINTFVNNLLFCVGGCSSSFFSRLPSTINSSLSLLITVIMFYGFIRGHTTVNQDYTCVASFNNAHPIGSYFSFRRNAFLIFSVTGICNYDVIFVTLSFRIFNICGRISSPRATSIIRRIRHVQRNPNIP